MTATQRRLGRRRAGIQPRRRRGEIRRGALEWQLLEAAFPAHQRLDQLLAGRAGSGKRPLEAEDDPSASTKEATMPAPLVRVRSSR